MIFWFVLAVLATWRVTHLLASEDGPGDIVFLFRKRLGQSLAGGLMDCFNCLSIWVAAPMALAVSREPAEWFLSWLAVSGGACLLEHLGNFGARQVGKRVVVGESARQLDQAVGAGVKR